jgi:hypothetical protein
VNGSAESVTSHILECLGWFVGSYETFIVSCLISSDSSFCCSSFLKIFS